ncbi:MAG TPA: hypothetical protein VKZ96_11565 [Thermomicrobiales bacterium]|nr:hypothetical protein [Thermomicrobiales bacterium]
MSARWARQRLEDFEELEDEWGDGETIERIRRRERPADIRPRRDGKRAKKDRRREPPIHKREEI